MTDTPYTHCSGCEDDRRDPDGKDGHTHQEGTIEHPTLTPEEEAARILIEWHRSESFIHEAQRDAHGMNVAALADLDKRQKAKDVILTRIASAIRAERAMEKIRDRMTLLEVYTPTAVSTGMLLREYGDFIEAVEALAAIGKGGW